MPRPRRHRHHTDPSAPRGQIHLVPRPDAPRQDPQCDQAMGAAVAATRQGLRVVVCAAVPAPRCLALPQRHSTPLDAA
jgi:hypothetical protein